MTNPSRQSYSSAERREIVEAARTHTRELLRRLEQLAQLSGVVDDAQAEGQGNGEATDGGT